MKHWHITGWFDDVCRRAYIALLAKQTQCAGSPRQRRMMLISAALTGGSLAVTSAAHAATASGGVAELFHVGTAQAAAMKSDAGILFAALGFGGAGYGGINWIRKGREGEHSQLKAHQIIVPILAGAALGAIGFVMIKAGETVGIEGASHGVVPS